MAMTPRKIHLLLSMPDPIVAAVTQADKIEVACVLVDRSAEAQRQRLITPGAGQAMSYREKTKQAVECLATSSATVPPVTGVYVLLDSEVGITPNADGTITADAYQVAVLIDGAYQTWLAREAAINAVRVKAKSDIKAASTSGAIATIMAAIVWPQ